MEYIGKTLSQDECNGFAKVMSLGTKGGRSGIGLISFEKDITIGKRDEETEETKNKPATKEETSWWHELQLANTEAEHTRKMLDLRNKGNAKNDRIVGRCDRERKLFDSTDKWGRENGELILKIQYQQVEMYKSRFNSGFRNNKRR